MVQIQPRFRQRTMQAEQSLGGASALDGDQRDRTLLGTERLLRFLLALESRPAVLFLETFNPRSSWLKMAQDPHTVMCSYCKWRCLTLMPDLLRQLISSRFALSHHHPVHRSCARSLLPRRCLV